MSTETGILFPFIKTAAMLAVVIAVLLLLLYCVKRFSMGSSGKGEKRHIKVLSTHHFSPKEKIVLVDVLDEKYLIGVTPQAITPIAAINKTMDPEKDSSIEPAGFPAVLKKNLQDDLK